MSIKGTQGTLDIFSREITHSVGEIEKSGGLMGDNKRNKRGDSLVLRNKAIQIIYFAVTEAQDEIFKHFERIRDQLDMVPSEDAKHMLINREIWQRAYTVRLKRKDFLNEYDSFKTQKQRYDQAIFDLYQAKIQRWEYSHEEQKMTPRFINAITEIEPVKFDLVEVDGQEMPVNIEEVKIHFSGAFLRTFYGFNKDEKVIKYKYETIFRLKQTYSVFYYTLFRSFISQSESSFNTGDWIEVEMDIEQLKKKVGVAFEVDLKSELDYERVTGDISKNKIGKRVPEDAYPCRLTIDDYPRFNDFKKRSLDPAIKDIVNNTNIEIEYDLMRSGRGNKVQSVVFRIRHQASQLVLDPVASATGEVIQEAQVIQPSAYDEYSPAEVNLVLRELNLLGSNKKQLGKWTSQLIDAIKRYGMEAIKSFLPAALNSRARDKVSFLLKALEMNQVKEDAFNAKPATASIYKASNFRPRTKSQFADVFNRLEELILGYEELLTHEQMEAVAQRMGSFASRPSVQYLQTCLDNELKEIAKAPLPVPDKDAGKPVAMPQKASGQNPQQANEQSYWNNNLRRKAEDDQKSANRELKAQISLEFQELWDTLRNKYLMFFGPAKIGDYTHYLDTDAPSLERKDVGDLSNLPFEKFSDNTLKWYGRFLVRRFFLTEEDKDFAENGAPAYAERKHQISREQFRRM
ncbi:replication initiation protein [Persicobacter psychrovividus]|uniref:Initiator Rep protein domain-containing protein n=1 Tax=Persicobacter psychrovividus TaxID=387638 RepID=A0ABM7VIW2_9BACT|nr:hypothetical protein PEPS_31720 [Persicobacter psychrovividus]